jgi:hypothetical protein
LDNNSLDNNSLDNNSLCFGHAQKIINVTLKNMLVCEVAKNEEWYKKLVDMRVYLHVPVDRYVMRAAYKQLGIRVLFNKENKKIGELLADEQFSDEKVKKPYPWSKIVDYDIYFAFQDKIRNTIETRDDCKYPEKKSPIDWEFDAWMVGKSVSND